MSEATPSPSRAKTRPKVSIGLPCYNSVRYLAQSIESLLAQTYGDIELIICDNASTDGTQDICEQYAARDPRVRYYRNPTNIGMNPNFNRTFELSDSKYFKFSTADDFWAPGMVADAVEVLESDDSIALCYPRAILVDADGNETRRYEDDVHLMQDDPAERFRQLYDRIGLCNHHLGVLRSSAIRKTQLFGRPVAADYEFLAELSLYGKFYRLPEYQFFRRFHEDSSSWGRDAEAQAARRFYAANVHRLSFPTWRNHFHRARAVARSPLPFGSKLGLYGYLTKRFYWDLRLLGRELRYDLPLVFGRIRRSSPPKPESRSDSSSGTAAPDAATTRERVDSESNAS